MTRPFSRRSALLTGTAALAVGGCTSAGTKTATVILHETASPGVTATATSTVTVSNPAPLGTFTATITMAGVPYVFTTVGATDLGDYVDPLGRFTQKCLMATNAGMADFYVYFRPDSTSSRAEVVFEFCKCFNGANTTYNGSPSAVKPAYTVVIAKDGTTLATVNVAKHNLYMRWRWQSAVRPATVSIASLRAAKKVPPYDRTMIGARRAAVHGYDGPMQANGVVTAMGTSGERDDIGVFTESQADYVMYEDAQGLGTVRAWMEAHGAFAICYRDENTHAPIDFVNTYPNADASGRSGPPNLAVPYTYQTDSDYNASHSPDFAYLHYMVTGDPYALEAMQFQTTADYCGTPNKTLFGMDSSLRYYAWELRTLLFNSVAAPASVPSWLKPQSYWQTYLDRNLAWTIPHISYGSSGVLQTRFQWATLDSDVAAQGTINTLMELYTTAVWCMAADLYPATNWVAVRDFSIRNAIARTNNTSGWNRSIPTVYGWQVAPNGSGSSATIFTTWAAMWAYNITPAAYSYGDTIGYDPAGQIIGPKVNPNYVVETNFSLSWCGQRGNTAAAACNAWAKPYCLTYTRSLLRWAV